MSSHPNERLAPGTRDPAKFGSHPLRRNSPTMSTALATRIKAAFERSGLSQLDLATAVGVDESTVSLWLSGGRTPRVKNLEKLARAMGLEASELWSGPEATPANAAQASVLHHMSFLDPVQQEAVAGLVRSMRAASPPDD